MSTPTVFISYSHADEAWTKKLLPQLQSLEQAGVAMHVWHDRKIDGGDQWYPDIQAAMSHAAAAILLISPDFLASAFCVKEEVPFLLKRQEEQGMLLIPVLLRACVWKAHRWLRDRQMTPRDGKTVAIDFAGHLADSVFADVAEQVLNHFQQTNLAQTASVSDQQLETISLLPDVAAFPAVDLTHLPETGSALFGRDAELRLLDEAWASQEQTSSTTVRILAFTAYGGVGKSTLANHWLSEMERDHYRGATRVFGWSFYSQGVRDDAVASTDVFIDTALRFFGDTDPAALSPWDRGARLARLVGDQRALLVLDGLEPLQSAQTSDRGRLRDPALESLLRGLSRKSAGLCIITTREPLFDLAGRSGVLTRDLEQITPQAGRALLRTARVVGGDAELEALASRFGPNALAVSLLGAFLYAQPGHGVRAAQALERFPGEPIDRVLTGFEQWFGEGPEREALWLLGFFERPADPGCLSALRAAPAISGLSDYLVGLGEAEWELVLARLQRLRLIQLRVGEPGRRSVDSHPVVREHLAWQVSTQHPAVWRAAHRRLYEHLCATTRENNQPTLEDLQPLYQAVSHGCQAGMQQEAFKLFDQRINRKNDKYPTTKLGAFGSDLAAAACFFEKPWNCISAALDENAKTLILNKAAFCLRAMGRVDKAFDLTQQALESLLGRKNWHYAAILAHNLSELELILGRVIDAVHEVERAVTYADRQPHEWPRRVARIGHANALYQGGVRDQARMRFGEVETIQAQASLPIRCCISREVSYTASCYWRIVSALHGRWC
jgi:tetratricopeptide (TPR) repeat protein